MNILRRIIPLYLLVLAGFFPVRGELARIGMVHFTGNVESAGYLGGSLSSAIDDSLKKKFSYQRIPEDKINEALAELTKIGIFDPRKIPEKNNLLRIAVALNADILIFGSYGIIDKPQGHKPAENEVTKISMRTYVYYVTENRTAELPELKPNLDASLFEAINTSAENVVNEFKKITVETEGDEETASIQTAATLRMAWLPPVPQQSNKAVTNLYTQVSEGMRGDGYGVQISAKGVERYARKSGWGAATAATGTEYFAATAAALKSDLVFWPGFATEAGKQYITISAYHAQLKQVLFTVREELVPDADSLSAKLKGEILARLRGHDFAVTAQVAGLKGSGLVLDFGGKEFPVLPGETLKDFGQRFKSGETYALTVKKTPKEPRQFCHVRNGRDKVTFKNTEILITCITDTVPVVVNLTEFYGGELVISLDGKEELKIDAVGAKKFEARVEDQQLFEIGMVRLPQMPAQYCKVGPPSKLGDRDTIDVNLWCRKVPEHLISGYLGYPAMGSLGSSADSLAVDQNFPVGQMSSYLAVTAAYQVKNILPYNLVLGAQLNFSMASATLPVQMFSGETSTDTVKTNMVRTDLILFTAYPVPLPYKLELLPYGGFGYSYQSLWRSGGANLSAGFTPVVSLGAILQYDYTPNLKLLFKTGPDLYFYSGGQNLVIWNFSVGVGKQFI